MPKKKSAFGSGLFGHRKKVEPECLYDFAQHGVLNNPEFTNFNANDYVTWTDSTTGNWLTHSNSSISTTYIVPTTSPEKQKKDTEDEKKKITPKELYKLEVLNQVGMSIVCNPDYIKDNVELLRKKHGMIRKDSGASKYGKEELLSLIERLENRKNFKKFEEVINKYPHTTSEAVGSILGKEDHLRCKLAEEFIPDFPKDAIDAMEEYTNMCLKLCNKKPVFYVIADKKDFGVIDKKRDPILLAQSPFGFFWQILGAWDEEMMFLGDL